MQLKRAIFTTILFAFYFYGQNVFAESVNVKLQVAVCNSNLICEDVIGENYGSCPSDCEPPPEPVTPTASSSGVAPGGYSYSTDQTNNQSPQVSQIDDFINQIKDQPVGIKNGIKISPEADRVTFSFDTFFASLLSVSWGKTHKYELGNSTESTYRQSFVSKIFDLEPETQYFFQFNLKDSLGRNTQYEGQFITSSLRKKATLPVINDFKISKNESDESVLLTWNIRPIKELYQSKAHVRLTRSEFRYPNDPLEGKVIYEGDGEQVTDGNLVEDKEYYYSLFVINDSGVFSAPAIIKYVHIIKPGNYIGIDDTSYDPLLRDGRSFTDIQAKEIDYPDLCQLSQSRSNLQMRIIQENREVEAIHGAYTVFDNQNFSIQTKKGSVADKDKVILCLISKDTGKYSLYMLTRNDNDVHELIFPSTYSIFIHDISYKFILNMLKYDGEISQISDGDIKIVSTRGSPLSYDNIIFIGILAVIWLLWFLIRKIFGI